MFRFVLSREEISRFESWIELGVKYDAEGGDGDEDEDDEEAPLNSGFQLHGNLSRLFFLLHTLIDLNLCFCFGS